MSTKCDYEKDFETLEAASRSLCRTIWFVDAAGRINDNKILSMEAQKLIWEIERLKTLQGKGL